MLLVVALTVLLGFGALAIDTGYMMLARAQAQDIADAASQAALIVLRQTGDEERARDAALRVVGANAVAGAAPRMIALELGAWDDTLANPSFVAGDPNPNAVRVEVARFGERAVPHLLARIWGYDRFDVSARATSATRSIQVAFVLDITGSWGERDFADAREAVLLALDMLHETASGVDEIAMTIFTNRFAWVYTEWTNIAVDTPYAEVRATWDLLNIASKAGVDDDPKDGDACDVYGTTHPRFNDFTTPAGGCYPAMPREYRDEAGTDHSTGILQAKQLFEERSNGASYRAMIVITDGRPNGFAAAGTQRAEDGYVEDRWREFLGDAPRSEDEIVTATVDATTELWEDAGVHTWAVSLVQDHAMLRDMVQGDGYAVVTDDSAELSAILAQIISEMPLALVE